MTKRHHLIAGAAVVAVLLLPSTIAARHVTDPQDRRAPVENERARLDVTPDVVLLRQFQERLDAYMVMRGLRDPHGLEHADTDVYWFESDEDIPSELLCLPNTSLRAPIMGRDDDPRQAPPLADLRVNRPWESGRVLFTADLEELFRRFVAQALAPVDQARVLRVMPLFPAGVPVQIVSEDLFRALPRLPDGLEYRFRDRDLLVVDLDGNRVVDEIWLALAASGT
ncbi:MAG TPA: hypothetical protein VH701_13535 [Vicinamibacterales bacterium]|jgi:hypothetical protein